MSRVSGAPDVTFYRQDVDALVGGDSKSALQRMRAQKRFDYFVLRHSTDRSDVYDKQGKLITADAPVPYPTSMSTSELRCDNDALVRQSTWLIPNPTACCSFEAHAGQSAAGRSNFHTMLDQMLNMAKNDKDREHIYVLSHHSPCPRSVLAADLTLVTERAQGTFLDFYNRLKKGWPLCETHHKHEMARTFSSCRYAELRRWLRIVRQARRPAEDMQRFEMVLMSLPLNVRFQLAQCLINETYPKFSLVEGGVEQLSDADLRHNIDAIGYRMDQLLAVPMSNS